MFIISLFPKSRKRGDAQWVSRLYFLILTDGVLNTNYTKELTPSGAIFVDDNKIKILKSIIDRTNAKIVLSSTWRIGWRHVEMGMSDSSMAQDFLALKRKLSEYDIRIYDKTPIFSELRMGCRGKEIESYLDSRDDIDGYVILDDLSGKWLRPCSSHLLQTSEWSGLEEKHIKTIEKILNMEV